jgi:hypothetical protein
MRLQAVMALLAIAFSIAVPPFLPLTIDHGWQAAIGTIDVCHTATPVLSSNGDMPCMNECPCNRLPLAQNKVPEIVNSPFRPFLIAFQDEHPPKV